MKKAILLLLAFLPAKTFADNFYTISTYWEYIDYFWWFSVYLFMSIAVITIIIWSFLYMFSSYSNNSWQLWKELVQWWIISIFLLLWTKVFYSDIISKIQTWEEKTLSWLSLAVNNVIWYLVSLSFVILWVSILYSIYIYLTSFWDEKKVKVAKKTFIYSLIWSATILWINYIVSIIQKFF